MDVVNSSENQATKEEVFAAIRRSVVATGISVENSLTLDEIRKGLKKNNVEIIPSNNSNLLQHENSKFTAGDVLKVADEISVYCNLLEVSKARAVEEAICNQKINRSLEVFLNSASQREMETLIQNDAIRELGALMEDKYERIKDRAKNLIREGCVTQTSLQSAFERVSNHLQTFEMELSSADVVAGNQKAELERAREAKLTFRSPGDVRQLDEKISKLELDNKKLRTDSHKLRYHLGQMQLSWKERKMQQDDKDYPISKMQRILILEDRVQKKVIEELTEESTLYQAYVRQLLKYIEATQTH